jgi:hemerythrin-like metal-binding protein
MDQQHQAIMDGLNELHQEMMKGNRNDAVTPLINNLVSLARKHFAAEERLMASAGFPGLADHRAKHREVSRKVQEFIARHEKGDMAAYSQFMYFLRDWFTKHMENDDREYAPWLAEHGIR